MTKNNLSGNTEQLEVVISLAKELMESENYEDAIEVYNLAIELDSNNASIYCDRAWVYSELEEDEKAISDYTKAIELDPNYTDAYKNLGEFYKNLGEYEKSIANYNKIIELKPNEANGYYLRGIVYSYLREYETAIVDYNKAIELDPSFSFTYYTRGIASNELGEYEKAIADFTQSIKLYPIFGFTYHSRGNAYKNLGEYEKAIADYNKAIEIYSNLDYFYYDRGEVYSELEEYEKAISDYTKAIELEPDNTHYQEALKGAVLLKKQKEDDLNFIDNDTEIVTNLSESIETFKLPNSKLFTQMAIESHDSNKLFLNENTYIDTSSYRVIFTTKNNQFICVNLTPHQLSVLKITIKLEARLNNRSWSAVDDYYQERLADKAQLLTNEEQCYELFNYFFPKDIKPIQATNLIKKFTVFCEQKQVIPCFSKFFAGNTAIMDACVFDEYENEEILIFDAMEECYQKYRGPFYFGSDFEIFIRNPMNSFSYPSFVIFNEFGLITKNPLTLPDIFSPVPESETAFDRFDRIFWNCCNYDLLGIAEKDNKLVIIIQPLETLYLGITNMKDDDSFQEREEKKATLMFIYFLLKKYFKIYKKCKDLPYIRYDSVPLLPLETEEQTSFETIIELLDTTNITIADFDTLLKDIETIPWIF